MKSSTLSRITHGPPTLSLADELHFVAFCRQAFRELKPNGRSKSGASVTRGAVRRLKEAGFGRTLVRVQALGVVAHK